MPERSRYRCACQGRAIVESMAKKERATSSLSQVALADLQSAPKRVVSAARREGGVFVVDEHGRTLFRLWMPVDPVPGFRG